VSSLHPDSREDPTNDIGTSPGNRMNGDRSSTLQRAGGRQGSARAVRGVLSSQDPDGDVTRDTPSPCTRCVRRARGRSLRRSTSISCCSTPGTQLGSSASVRWGHQDEWPRYATGMLVPDFEGDPELAPMWAGESVAVVNDLKPAADIIRDLVREAEAAMDHDPHR
jgi:hypothetical protein